MKTITYNPETHVLVPREPSDEMLRKAIKVDLGKDCDERGNCISLYQVMIAAAPQPEQVESEPVIIEEPDYHFEAMGCGLEDRNITDRYEAMHYGWDCAISRMFEQIPDEPLYTTPQPDRVTTKESYVELDIHSNPSRTEQQRKLDGSLEVGQLLGNGQNQETSHSKTVGDILLADAFRGDTANLIESIVALVSLDRAGVLVPHGIGGHARSLLESAAIRLSQPDRVAELEAALKVAREAIDALQNGLKWYQDAYPDSISEADHEEIAKVDAAIAKINEVLK